MRLQQYLTELFDKKPEGFQITSKTKTVFHTKWKVGKIEFQFDADLIRDNWTVIFYRQEKKAQQIKTMGDLNQKEVIQVGSGVKASFDIWLKKYDPEKFKFTAEDKSHMKVYDIVSRGIKRKFNYTFYREQDGKTIEYYFDKGYTLPSLTPEYLKKMGLT